MAQGSLMMLEVNIECNSISRLYIVVRHTGAPPKQTVEVKRSSEQHSRIYNRLTLVVEPGAMIASILHAASLEIKKCGKQLRACCNSLTSTRSRLKRVARPVKIQRCCEAERN